MKSTTIYYLFSGAMDFGMAAIVTSYSPFLLSIGLSLGEVALVNAVFWAVLIFAELPTGMLADGRGRAWSLTMGALFFAVGAVVYAFVGGLWSVMVAEALIGIGGAFISGAQQAWIADALDREGRMSELQKVYATASIIRGIASVVAGICGAWLAILGYRIIWIPMIVLSLGSAFLSYFQMNGKGEPEERITEMEALKKSVKLLRTNRALIWIVASTVVFACVLPFNHYWAPYFKEQVGQAWLGIMWAIMYGGFTLSGFVIRQIKVSKANESMWIAWSIVATGLGLALIPMFGGVVFPVAMVVLHEFGRGMFFPLTDSFVQHRVESSYRATFGSLQSFVGRSGNVLIPIVVWLSIEGKADSVETISQVWIVVGGLMAVGGLVLWLVRPNGSA